MKIQTLQDALSLVPTHWPLVPGVDKWKEGDEVWSVSRDEWFLIPAYPHEIGGIVGEQTTVKNIPGRRPIPEDVALSEAWWILYNSLVNYKLAARIYSDYVSAVADPFEIPGKGYDTQSGLTAEQTEALGGESAVIQMLTEGPGALWKWAMENRK